MNNEKSSQKIISHTFVIFHYSPANLLFFPYTLYTTGSKSRLVPGRASVAERDTID